MANLDPLHPLQSSVLEILANVRSMDTEELWSVLKKQHGIGVSIATLYRILKELEEQQVIVRTRGSIQLNSVWISHVLRFAETARSKQSEAQGAFDFRTLKDGETRSFYGESLLGLDPVWNHTLLEIVRTEKKETWYMYNSHPWYSLGMPETERRLYQGLMNEEVHCRMIYGNRTFLDLYGEKIIRIRGMRSVCIDDPPLPSDGYALWLCGDYVVDCIMPKIIAANFAFFFKTVTSIDQFDPQLFADIFRMRARCKLSIRRNSVEAKKIRRLLEKFY